MESVKLDRFVPGGQTIGTLSSGLKAFVWGGLPGEVVEFKTIKKKRSYLEGIVTKVDQPSLKRVEPRDDCYLSTSPWQVLDYDYELEQKAELVREAFRQEGIASPSTSFPSSSARSERSEPSDIPMLRGGPATWSAPSALSSLGNDEEKGWCGESITTDSKDYFYRNKMEYSLWWDNDTKQILLAFHERGSHRKIPITSSSIERPEVLAEALAVVAKMNERGDEARRYQSLLVRCSQDGQVSSALFENGEPHPKMKQLTDSLLGHKFTYSPNGFFQINLPVYELALKEIKKHIITEKVVDMYAGVGTIGLTVARDRKLTLVETNKDAFAELKSNCNIGLSSTSFSSSTARPERSEPSDTPMSAIADVDPVTWSAPSVLHSLDTMSEKGWCDSPIAILAKSEEALEYITHDATVIVDPPRAGLHRAVVDRLLEVLPPTIIYLSCNPTTQARDIKPLLSTYQTKLVQPYNFFPRTPHIENLVVLEHK